MPIKRNTEIFYIEEIGYEDAFEYKKGRRLFLLPDA